MKKNTKIIIGILIAVVVILVVWYGTGNQDQSNLRIGFIGHLSGDYASYAVPLQHAVELAVQQVNENGGVRGRQVELVSEDDASKADVAASAMNKLVTIDQVNYIISTQASGITAAITPIAEANHRVLMIALGSAPGLTDNKQYVFRSIASDIYQASEIVNLMHSLGSQKIAGLYTNDAYGIGVQDKVNADQSVSHAADEMFEAGSGDFRTQLTKIKSSGADTLIIVAHDEFPSILKQIRELGLQMKIIASETFKDTAMLAKSGSYAEEVYVPFLADQEDHLNFNNAYKVAFSEDSSAYSKYAYDGALALLKAIEDSGDDPDVVAAALFRKSFEGASGKVGFNTEGDRTGLVYLTYVVQGGSFVEY